MVAATVRGWGGGENSGREETFLLRRGFQSLSSVVAPRLLGSFPFKPCFVSRLELAHVKIRW